MAVILLTCAILSAIPAVLVRSAEWAFALGLNALVWAGLAELVAS